MRCSLQKNVIECIGGQGYPPVSAAYIISVVVMTAACGMQMVASLTPFPEVDAPLLATAQLWRWCHSEASYLHLHV